MGFLRLRCWGRVLGYCNGSADYSFLRGILVARYSCALVKSCMDVSCLVAFFPWLRALACRFMFIEGGGGLRLKPIVYDGMVRSIDFREPEMFVAFKETGSLNEGRQM